MDNFMFIWDQYNRISNHLQVLNTYFPPQKST